MRVGRSTAGGADCRDVTVRVGVKPCRRGRRLRVGRSTAGGADCRDVTARDLVGGGEGGREKREDGRRWKMELKFLYFLRCLCEENCFMLVLGTGQYGHKEKIEK